MWPRRRAGMAIRATRRRWKAKRVDGLVEFGQKPPRLGRRNHVDPTLTKCFGSIVAIALNITLVLGILGYFGIETTSFAVMLAVTCPDTTNITKIIQMPT